MNQNQNDPDGIARDFFETNRTMAAQVRDNERQIAARREPPVNLAAVPRDQWDRCVNFEVLPPEAIAKYLKDRPELPFPTEEIHALEDEIERAYGVSAPFGIAMTLRYQRTGRTWSYAPEAAPYLTGFYLLKDI